MSVSDEEPYSTIFASLKHPIRRRILRMLSKKPMSFSEMLEVLGVTSSFLTYHLENLGELVGKIDDNKYRLSSFGEAAIATMTKVEDIPTTAPQQSPEHPETRSSKWSSPLGFIAKRFKTSETKPRKVVGKSVAIALGITCILLIAFIAYFSITGISAQNSYNNLQNQNNQLQTWLNGNETLLSQTQANLTNLQNQLNILKAQVGVRPYVANVDFYGNGTKIDIDIGNSGALDTTIIQVYIGTSSSAMENQIITSVPLPAGTTQRITVNYNWTNGTTYYFEVLTSTSQNLSWIVQAPT